MQFSFLTSGPALEFDLAQDFGPVPHLESPVLSGVGGRTFAFTPSPESQALGVALDGSAEYLQTLIDADGRDIRVSRRLAPPLTWWLRWELSSGVLTTHLREVDGIDRANLVASSLRVDETGTTPFLLLSLPLKRFVYSFPGYQEYAMYRQLTGPAEVGFVRPSFLPEGRTVETVLSGLSFVRAGTSFGAEVQVAASSSLEATAILDQVLGSLTEAGLTQ